MEIIINNEPSTPDSSNQTINISYDTEKEHEPEIFIELEEIDDLVRKFELKLNELLHSVTQDCV